MPSRVSVSGLDRWLYRSNAERYRASLYAEQRALGGRRGRRGAHSAIAGVCRRANRSGLVAATHRPMGGRPDWHAAQLVEATRVLREAGCTDGCLQSSSATSRASSRRPASRLQGSSWGVPTTVRLRPSGEQAAPTTEAVDQLGVQLAATGSTTMLARMTTSLQPSVVTARGAGVRSRASTPGPTRVRRCASRTSLAHRERLRHRAIDAAAVVYEPVQMVRRRVCVSSGAAECGMEWIVTRKRGACLGALETRDSNKIKKSVTFHISSAFVQHSPVAPDT